MIYTEFRKALSGCSVRRYWKVGKVQEGSVTIWEEMMVPWTKMEAAETDQLVHWRLNDEVCDGLALEDEGEQGVRDDAVVLTHPLSLTDGGDRKRVGEG